jgi:hypothetical protein
MFCFVGVVVGPSVFFHGFLNLIGESLGHFGCNDHVLERMPGIPGPAFGPFEKIVAQRFQFFGLFRNSAGLGQPVESRQKRGRARQQRQKVGRKRATQQNRKKVGG